MKKETIWNLKLIGTSVLLSGLSIFLVNKYVDDNENKIEVITDLSYDTENQKMIGSLSYKEAMDCLKIVTLEDDFGNQFQELMYVYVKETLVSPSKRYAFQDQTSYIRLSDGWEMISFDYAGKEEQENKNPIRVYGEFRVLEEENFIGYLLENLGRKETYEVEDILDVYEKNESLDQVTSQKEVKIYESKN